MKVKQIFCALSLVCGVSLLTMPFAAPPVLAQSQDQDATASAQPEDTAPAPLGAEDMDVLVARIALYPDDLVAVITASSLFPLQIVEADRFLQQSAKDSKLKPKSTWDGSVISLLNYPEIVHMMSNDLEWTQKLGNAVTDQEQDVLDAIQRLRKKAVDEGVIKTDEKVKVSQEDNNVVIAPASEEQIYVPQYEPQMLYEPNYAPAPVTYYPQPYPYYYDPTATFFAAAVTGVVWGATVDWVRHGLWGGRWGYHNNFYINCRNCFNNRKYNGRVRWNDVDWRHVDRHKISYNRKEFNTYHRRDYRRSLESNKNNNLHRKAVETRKAERIRLQKERSKSGLKQNRTNQTQKTRLQNQRQTTQGQKTRLRNNTDQKTLKKQQIREKSKTRSNRKKDIDTKKKRNTQGLNQYKSNIEPLNESNSRTRTNKNKSKQQPRQTNRVNRSSPSATAKTSRGTQQIRRKKKK